MEARKQYFALFLSLGLLASGSHLCAQKTPTVTLKSTATSKNPLAKEKAKKKRKKLTPEQRKRLIKRKRERAQRKRQLLLQKMQEQAELMFKDELNSVQDVNPEHICGICHDAIQDQTQMVSGEHAYQCQCKCNYHADCLKNWNCQSAQWDIFYDTVGKCPTCRKEVYGPNKLWAGTKSFIWHVGSKVNFLS